MAAPATDTTPLLMRKGNQVEPRGGFRTVAAVVTIACLAVFAILGVMVYKGQSGLQEEEAGTCDFAACPQGFPEHEDGFVSYVKDFQSIHQHPEQEFDDFGEKKLEFTVSVGGQCTKCHTKAGPDDAYIASGTDLEGGDADAQVPEGNMTSTSRHPDGKMERCPACICQEFKMMPDLCKEGPLPGSAAKKRFFF